MKPKRHLVIPDCQVKPGDNTDHLGWVGNYIEAKRPDVIANLGDFNDVISLNSYNLGKASAEGTRYVDDMEAGKAANRKLTKPWINKKGYSPFQAMFLGNHEYRIVRETEANPKLAGKLSLADLGYEQFGWKVYPFLQVVRINDVDYAHYFTSGPKGAPVPNARTLLNVRHSSAVMGHVQDRDIAIHKQTQHVALFAGLCTMHDEAYLGPQGNTQRRGIWMLNEVRNGTFDPMFISLDFLRREYS